MAWYGRPLVPQDHRQLCAARWCTIPPGLYLASSIVQVRRRHGVGSHTVRRLPARRTLRLTHPSRVRMPATRMAAPL